LDLKFVLMSRSARASQLHRISNLKKSSRLEGEKQAPHFFSAGSLLKNIIKTDATHTTSNSAIDFCSTKGLRRTSLQPLLHCAKLSIIKPLTLVVLFDLSAPTGDL
jgi:hypothetical protein